jgi:SM-20-related protein
MYLNVDWKPGDGGELRIYHDRFDQDITPTDGKIVFFNSSEFEHEVLLTNKTRLSITGWLKS